MATHTESEPTNCAELSASSSSWGDIFIKIDYPVQGREAFIYLSLWEAKSLVGQLKEIIDEVQA